MHHKHACMLNQLENKSVKQSQMLCMLYGTLTEGQTARQSHVNGLLRWDFTSDAARTHFSTPRLERPDQYPAMSGAFAMSSGFASGEILRKDFSTRFEQFEETLKTFDEKKQ